MGNAFGWHKIPVGEGDIKREKDGNINLQFKE